jgi:hypothetical protein
MRRVELNWLQDAEILGRIGREPLVAIVDLLAPVLAEQGIALPDPSLPDTRYFTQWAAIFRSQPIKAEVCLPPFPGFQAQAGESLPAGAVPAPGPDSTNLSLAGKLLLLLSRAAPEELAAIYRLAAGHLLAASQRGAGRALPEPVLADGSSQAGAQGSPAYVFRRVGRHWEVVCGGGRAFRLRNTLGARYLDYLLHRPNNPIRAFDVEVEVQPEKGEVRARDSFQPESDAQAMRDYRQALEGLKAKQAVAKAAGDQEGVERLDGEIEAFQSALREGGGAADTGERARNNVRKAVAAVIEKLSEGGPEERAFAEHLRTHLSIGHECLYSQPQGRIWV